MLTIHTDTKVHKMDKKKNRAITLGAAVLAGLCLLAGIALAAGEGSQNDPLITLSYLTQTATEDILDQVDQRARQHQQELAEVLDQAIEEYSQKMEAALGASTGEQTAATYTVITLKKDQELKMEIGCEAMLRVGTAACVAPSAPGLIDTTSGETLNNGSALITNHLYMATIAGRSIKATAATTKVLVRGSFTIV